MQRTYQKKKRRTRFKEGTHIWHLICDGDEWTVEDVRGKTLGDEDKDCFCFYSAAVRECLARNKRLEAERAA